jgi:exosortase
MSQVGAHLRRDFEIATISSTGSGRLVAWVGGIALIAGCIFATLDAWSDLLRTGWQDEESSHILLVPLVFTWIFCRRLPLLSKVRASRQWVGTLLLGFGGILWSVGYRQQIHTLWHLGAVLVLVGGVVSLSGPDVIVKFLPAFGALIFLVPLAGERRQQFAMPMQLLTAKITQFTCELLGMQVERQRNVLSLNGVGINIAEACNGMRMIITLIIVSYLYAFITPLRAYVRCLLLLASPVLAVFCNVIRLVPTVWMYGHTTQAAAERFHDLSAWVMLGVAFLLLMAGVSILRWLMLPVDLPDESQPLHPLPSDRGAPC